MELSVITGIVGSIVLLIGAAWPIEKIKEPTKSIKNWLFGIGSFIMLIYAILGYLAGGPVFYIVLELVVMLAVALMFLGTKDRMNTALISVAGILLILRSWIVFQGPSMILFIVAFVVLSLGYAYKMNTIRRFLFLAIGGALIALSSYLGASWIFFRLNVFFSLFSLIYAIKISFNTKKLAAKITQVAPAKKVIKKKPVATKTTKKK
ncbi:MAG: hypothetical protein NT085_00060 [candidate division SR1 bacterium]|nr:hypothetical protein [candidate division SR1 bacterium]